jgi:hypothetical protein
MPLCCHNHFFVPDAEDSATQAMVSSKAKKNLEQQAVQLQ